MLDLNKLEVFARVAEAGSFSKAAENLSISQSAVSQHILALEQSLGTSLFERNQRGVSLTVAGRTLQHYTEAIFKLVSEAEASVVDVHNLRNGQVLIGATPGIDRYLLPDWQQSYLEAYPRLKLTVQTGNNSEIVAAVLARTLALGLIEGEPHTSIDPRLIEVELDIVDLLVVAGPQHPWWHRSAILLSDLDRQPLIAQQAGNQTRSWLDGALLQYSVRPQLLSELDDPEAIKQLVMVQNALAILPAYVLRKELEQGRLRAVPLESQQLRRALKLIWLRSAPFSPVTRSFLRHLCGYYPVLRTRVS